MAHIVLEPGEVFEHFHSVPSQSMVIEGLVEFRVRDEAAVLGPGASRDIPANTLHSMKNLSPGRAILGCSHAPAAR